MKRFDEWMIEEGLSEASVSKYHTAIKGVLSDWAHEAGIIEGSLLDIQNASEFSNAVLKIKVLPIFKARDSVGNQMYTAALKKYAQYLYYASQWDIEDDIVHILENEEIKSTDKARMINARIGQGKYRRDLINLWGGCCVTGYPEVSMLMASHIKPWAQSTNKERLDKYNGLLLLPNLDKAFDAGLISFENSGTIVLSPSLSNPKILGINQEMSVKLKKQHLPYIEYHRNEVLKT